MEDDMLAYYGDATEELWRVATARTMEQAALISLEDGARFAHDYA